MPHVKINSVLCLTPNSEQLASHNRSVVPCVFQAKTLKVLPLEIVERKGLKSRYGRQLRRGSGSGCLQPGWHSVLFNGKTVMIANWNSTSFSLHAVSSSGLPFILLPSEKNLTPPKRAQFPHHLWCQIPARGDARRFADRVTISRKYSPAARSTTRAGFAWSAGRTFVCHCSRITARLPPKVSIVSWI